MEQNGKTFLAGLIVHAKQLLDGMAAELSRPNLPLAVIVLMVKEVHQTVPKWEALLADIRGHPNVQPAEPEPAEPRRRDTCVQTEEALCIVSLARMSPEQLPARRDLEAGDSSEGEEEVEDNDDDEYIPSVGRETSGTEKERGKLAKVPPAGGAQRSKRAKEFRCSVCEKSCVSRVKLQTHIYSKHTGETPFVCRFENCGKRFSSDKTTKRHYREHFESYQCHKCQRKFKRNDCMQRHFRYVDCQPNS